MYKILSRRPLQRSVLSQTHVVAQKIFTPDECKNVIEIGKSLKIEEAKTAGAKTDLDIRRSNVGWIRPNNDTNWIFARIDKILDWANNHYFNFDLNGYETLQFTEYKSEDSGFYDWHFDTQFDATTPWRGGMRKLSASVLLNDDFEGGEFMFNVGNVNKPVKVDLKVGDVVIFPSFMIHTVAPVTKGERYSTVAWVLGPKFV